MKKNIIAVVSWVMALWMCKIFLFSLPYKFTGHPDTQHIFGTIGDWMSGFLGRAIGNLFTSFGAIGVGLFELITSIVLLLPALLWVLNKTGIFSSSGHRAKIHRIGGIMAAMVMSGAVFFHIFTPLGIEVLHQGKSDGGSLFFAAVSILVSGVILFVINSLKIDDGRANE
ncbi:MAG: hypothetical protein ACI845_003677 [Gammaproteobacteria bacterium]|jgi:hypothetical protein